MTRGSASLRKPRDAFDAWVVAADVVHECAEHEVAVEGADAWSDAGHEGVRE
jgi:hypothetical protein